VTSNQHTGSDAAAVDFLARLGAAMVAANHPIGLVRRTLTMAGDHYGLTSQMLVLPNFVQYGGYDHAGGTTVRVIRSEHDLRFDQTFRLAHLVERAETGQVTPTTGSTSSTRSMPCTRGFPRGSTSSVTRCKAPRSR
jgi:hypothetical protein